MKNLIYATLLVLFFSVPVLGLAWQQDREQLRYNPAADKGEYAAPGDQIKYNPMEDEWSYEAPNSRLRYNPYEDKFEYAE